MIYLCSRSRNFEKGSFRILNDLWSLKHNFVYYMLKRNKQGSKNPNKSVAIMAGEVPCSSYMALYIISMHIVSSANRSANHWKLNLSSGKVEQASSDQDGSETKSNSSSSATDFQYQVDSVGYSNGGDALFDELSSQERMMGILSNRVISSDGAWIVTGVGGEDTEKVVHRKSCTDCKTGSVTSSKVAESSIITSDDEKHSRLKLPKNSTKSNKKIAVTCGKPINNSIYDNLRGISERHQHSHIPEPDVAMVFKGSGKSSDVDMAQLEQKLKKAKREILENGNPLSEKSAHVYNLIGNFWRIKGDTQKSIECFRKALSILPENPDFLLNLARVLFNLQYLDDAIILARKSLSHQPAGENSWLQHFTLGEILKSYGHPQEAVLHFHKAVELNPDFQPAKTQLRDLTVDPHPNVTHLTLFIILSLVVGVLLGLFMGTDAPKSQRHFNRAMAMRSIKLGINPRICRLKKSHF